MKLAPDVIKIDRGFTRGLDLDPVRRSLATALVAFAADTASNVVAERIETSGELNVLRELGVRYGQAQLLGRPVPFDELLAILSA